MGKDEVKLACILVLSALVLCVALVRGAGESSAVSGAASAAGATSVKVMPLASLSSQEKATCVALSAGTRGQQVSIVADGGMQYEVWKLNERSYQQFSTAQMGACYRYQGKYYGVAVP